MIYYKAFNPVFCDENDFYYTIGKEIKVEIPNVPNFIYAWGRFDTQLKTCIRHLPNLMEHFEFDAKPHICEVEPKGEIVQMDELIMQERISYYLTNRITVTRELTVNEIMQRLWDEGASLDTFIIARAPFEELIKLKEYFNNLDTAKRVLRLPYLTDNQLKELLPQKYHKYIGERY